MDEELRALERAASDPAARLKLARSLERAGRSDEAFLVLDAGKSDPDVRRELARWPAWTHPWGGAGGTFWLDVAPVTRMPQERWVADVRRGYGLAVSWAGLLLVGDVGDGKPTLFVFDPDDGRERWRAPLDGEWGVAHAVLRGDLVVPSGCSSCPVRDAKTGEVVLELGDVAAFLPPDLVAVESDGKTCTVHRWTDALRTFDPDPLWKIDRGGFASGARFWNAGDVVVASVGVIEFIGYDRLTGRVRWRAPDGLENGVLVDAEGAVGGCRFFENGVLIDNARKPHPDIFRNRDPWILAPRWLVLVDHERACIHDRSSGHVLGSIEPWAPTRTWAAARDVIYGQTPYEGDEFSFAGLTPAGDVLWELAMVATTVGCETFGAVAEVAVFPRRIYVLLMPGTLLCFEEPSAP